MDESNVKTLKLVIGVLLAGIIGYYALPVLAKMALDAVTIALCGISLFALWVFLPAISELLAQLSYRLWTFAIQADPISKLRRELKAHSGQIANMEQRIAESDAQVIQLENLLKQQKNVLSPDEIQEWSQQIGMLKTAGTELINLRNQSIKEHSEFERQVERAEAQYKIGKAFKSALGAFTFNNKSGKEAEGAKIAINEVQKQLAESQSKLNVVLSRNIKLQIPQQSVIDVNYVDAKVKSL
jgi:hypothetical protein